VITDESIAWLKNRKNKNKPFMMMVHHKAPHTPHDPAPRHKTLFADTTFPEPDTLFDDYAGRMPEKIANDLMNNRLLIVRTPQYRELVNKQGTDKEKLKEIYQAYMKGYLRLVASLDENVGRLLDFVEQEGLSRNTIVIYTSDNGYFLGEHGFMNKMWIYEPAMNLPFIMRYPGCLTPGSTEDAMLSWVDVAPTLIELAGGDAPEEMDGRSFSTLLDGNSTTHRREIFYQYHDQTFAPEHYGLRTDNYKIAHYTSFKGRKNFKPMWELFDLKNDPEEMNNLIDNPEYKDIAEELKLRLEKYGE
jgi:arylsulfatase A-like enzyme